MSAKRISEVFLLVHPFYSLSRGDRQMPLNVQRRKQLQFLAALWGKKIVDVAKNPNSLMVIVKCGEPVLPDKNSCWINQKAEAIIDFASSLLGDRLLVETDAIHPSQLRQEIARGGFQIDRSLFRGSAFGEWWGPRDCIEKEAKNLSRALNIAFRRIKRIPELSIGYLYSKQCLGKMDNNLRNRAASFRRKQRKSQKRMQRGK
ncbi:MAG: hypothetical protein PHD95_00455 [Candidatus ainarchaeum sp.]|nr:hypothetical protein [Candidatus ainarchaeum sp.]